MLGVIRFAVVLLIKPLLVFAPRMELYGAKAWVVIGAAVAGWVLAVIFLMGSINLALVNHALTINLYACELDYNYLVRNYTALARTTVYVLNQTLAVVNATGEVVSYNAQVLNTTGRELSIISQELAQVNNTVEANNYLLIKLYQMMVNKTGG